MRISLIIVFAAVFSIAHGASAAVEGVMGAAQQPLPTRDAAKLKLASANVLVFDTGVKQAIYSKGADSVTPIASVTKLMAASTASISLNGMSVRKPRRP